MSQSPTIDETHLATLIERFYARVRRDPQIGPLFNTAIADWDAHLRKLAAFWSSVMLASGRYKGNPMAAHLKLGITPAMFDTWLAIWDQTVVEVFTPDTAKQLRAKAHRIAESLQLALVYRLEEPVERTSGKPIERSQAHVEAISCGTRLHRPRRRPVA